MTKTGAIRDHQKGAVAKDEKQIITLVVQDYSLALSNQVVRVKLADASCGEFFNGEAGKDIVAQAFKTLQRFNVWVEGTVSFNAHGALELSHTQLKTF